MKTQAQAHREYWDFREGLSDIGWSWMVHTTIRINKYTTEVTYSGIIHLPFSCQFKNGKDFKVCLN
jgi:hypothetical protein